MLGTMGVTDSHGSGTIQQVQMGLFAGGGDMAAFTCAATLVEWRHWACSSASVYAEVADAGPHVVFEEAKQRPKELFVVAMRCRGDDHWWIGSSWKGKKGDLPGNVWRVDLGAPAKPDEAGGDSLGRDGRSPTVA